MKRATVADAFPLRWPDGVPRAQAGTRSVNGNFKMTFAAARDRLLDELRKMGARYVVISTDVPLRRDGLPYADGDPKDPGVAVYFDLDGEQHVLACDRWDRVRMNTQALALTVDALRGLERWGSTDIMRRAFSAFEMLAAPIVTPRSWREVLDIRDWQTANMATVRESYRQLAKLCHPDVGGDHAAMAELNAAMDAAERELGQGEAQEKGAGR